MASVMILKDFYCADCGMFIGALPVSFGETFFCADCGIKRMEQIKTDEVPQDIVFDIMRTNKGACTYNP